MRLSINYTEYKKRCDYAVKPAEGMCYAANMLDYLKRSAANKS
jgi:hypothetical protein